MVVVRVEGMLNVPVPELILIVPKLIDNPEVLESVTGALQLIEPPFTNTKLLKVVGVFNANVPP